MRGLLPYTLGGVVVVLALDMFAPPAGFGVSPAAWPVFDRAMQQTIDRRFKDDRLDVPRSRFGRGLRRKPLNKMPVGCEPAFSVLAGKPSASQGGIDVVGRCVAAIRTAAAA